MIPLHFEKIYATPARWEACAAALPLAPGELADCAGVRVFDETGAPVPTQARATSRHPDGSVRWLFVRFMARIPGGRAAGYALDLRGGPADFAPLDADEGGADTGAIRLRMRAGGDALLRALYADGSPACAVTLPVLRARGADCPAEVERWSLVERGEVCAVLLGEGKHALPGGEAVRFEVRLTCARGLPDVDVAYRLINTTDAPLHVEALSLLCPHPRGRGASCAAGISNYGTRWRTSEDGSTVSQTADEHLLLFEANEHNPEVFYGAFLADSRDAQGGVMASVYQAQQNYPKAIEAGAQGVRVSLVPEGVGRVVLQSGMAREQRVLVHPHGADEDLAALNDLATRYQMPNRPALDPDVYARSGVVEAVFTARKDTPTEMFLQAQADMHARAFGMLNWGDSPDMGYTAQGRGGGELVWTNNEYDYPHACALTYMRTGIRRYLDYLLVSARHWLDVDICHYSADPLCQDGQWEHTNGHCKNGRIMPSHQWVEGLLDLYHFTGDDAALDAALRIGENDLRQLARPEFAHPGDMNARETGWALRAFAALYRETNDARWLAPCGRIVAHFEAWEREYGLWLAPYTDNTRIRVVFMISVAAASLMRVWRIDPSERVRGMILRAVDDLVENARLENGLFYYKELPSLKRFGNNPIILEALAIAYELTGETRYLRAGLPTFRYVCRYKDMLPGGGAKRADGDAVITAGPGTKGFAQLMIPVTTYYAACMRAGVPLAGGGQDGGEDD